MSNVRRVSVQENAHESKLRLVASSAPTQLSMHRWIEPHGVVGPQPASASQHCVSMHSVQAALSSALEVGTNW
jgi:RIO-like serine/threonine protein kinase